MPDTTTPMNTTLDEYPMPAPSVSPTALAERNCVRQDLLPLTADRACQLTEELTVYAALPDGSLELPSNEDEIREYPPDTVFAVPKREWQQSMSFHIALNERMTRQPQRERAFLRHTGDCFAVYQRWATLKTETLESARVQGLSPRRAGYGLVYTAPLPAGRDVEDLEKKFRERPPADFHHRTVETGDLIVVRRNGDLKAWYLDMLSIHQETGLFEKVPLSREGMHREPLPMYDEIPVYRQSGRYAQEHGEIDAYFESFKTNALCRDAISRAVDEHYRNWQLDTIATVRQVTEEFGYDRTLYILACTIQSMEGDGRISRDNIRWARGVPVIPDLSSPNGGRDFNSRLILKNLHPGLLDIFTTAARSSYERSRPLSGEEITAEAERLLAEMKRLDFPNGPNQQGFVAEISEGFVSRANEGDLIMLSGMMPFRSFEVTPLREYYSRGLFARIAGDENRGPRRRLRQSSFHRRQSAAKRRKDPAR